MTDLLLALRDVVQVDPWLAALWLASAVTLAGLIVYGWRRLVPPR
jgi:hypothetical protein